MLYVFMYQSIPHLTFVSFVVKQIDQVAVRKTTEKKVLVFMKLALTDYAHDVIPKFNYYKQTMSHIQLGKATQLYLVIYQLVWEAKR